MYIQNIRSCKPFPITRHRNKIKKILDVKYKIKCFFFFPIKMVVIHFRVSATVMCSFHPYLLNVVYYLIALQFCFTGSLSSRLDVNLCFLNTLQWPCHFLCCFSYQGGRHFNFKIIKIIM